MDFQTLVDDFNRRIQFCGSHNRPGEFLIWVSENDEDDVIFQRAFWYIISKEWNAMDIIDHAAMSDLFCNIPYHYDDLTDDCRKALEVLPTKQDITIYRGQCETLNDGLAWTLDRAVAEKFARNGFRGRGNERPVLLVAEVDRSAIVMAFNDRDEREVVVWNVEDFPYDIIRLYEPSLPILASHPQY